MSDFVEQCRAEWKRLGVPDPIAEEMAGDLAADLGDAESEGVPAEEILGAGASDPHSFAASWAAERGVIPGPRGGGDGSRRPLALVAFTTLSATAVIVAGLLLLTREPKVGLVTSGTPPAGLAAPPPGAASVRASAAAPIEWILLVFAIVALSFAAWLWSRRHRSRSPGLV